MLGRFLESCITWKGHGQPGCDCVCQELDQIFTSAIENKIWCNISICKVISCEKNVSFQQKYTPVSSHQCFPSPQSIPLGQHAPSVRMKVCSCDPFTSLLWTFWSVWLGIDCVLLKHCSGITQLSVVSVMVFRKFIKSLYQAWMVLMMLQLNPPRLQQNITIFKHEITHKWWKDGLQLRFWFLKMFLLKKEIGDNFSLYLQCNSPSWFYKAIKYLINFKHLLNSPGFETTGS